MTQEDIKKAADELVDLFRPYVYRGKSRLTGTKGETQNAAMCAIKHCELVMFEYLGPHAVKPVPVTFNSYERERVEHYQSLKTELESRL